MKNPFKKAEQKDNPFRGLWEDAGSAVEMLERSPVPTEPKALPTGAVQSRVRWGVGGVFGGLIFFLAIQVILVLAIFQGIAFSGDLDVLTDPVSLTTHPAVIIASSIAMWASWVTWMWITSRKKGTNNFFSDFKLRIHWKRDLGLGLLIGLGLIVAVNGSSLLLEAFGVSMAGSDNGAVFGPGGGVAAAIMAVLIASIAGPFFEEVFFRGYILQAVRNTVLNQRDVSLRLGTQNPLVDWAAKHKNGLAVTLSSIVFGFMHFQGVDTFGQIYVVLVTGLLGAVLAFTTLRYGRLGPAIFAHMFYNGGTLLLAWMTASIG